MRISLPYATGLAVLLGQATLAANNPLATDDQRNLDALATELGQSDEFHLLRGVARAQYIGSLWKNNVTVDDRVNSDIDLAIDELVFSAVQKAVNSDPAHPKVYWTDAPPRKDHWFGLSVPGGRYSYDNPDCIYRTIPISHKHEYVVHGHRAASGPSDVTFSLIKNPNSQQTVASLSDSDLQVNTDGSFNITISSKDSDSKNHIKSNDQAVQLLVRENLGDWNSETADDLTVDIVAGTDSDDEDTKPASNETIIFQAKDYLLQSSFFYGFGALDSKTLSQPLNELKKPSQSKDLGTLTSQASSFGHFQLAEDESLVVTLNDGKSTYWAFPVYSLGMVTNSPRENLVSYNNKQAKPNNNGTYTFVVSAQDPGVYNWVNTTSRSQGLVMGRWQGLPTDNNTDSGIEVHSSVVKLDSLRDVLPAETVYVDSQHRQEQVQNRIRGYDRLHYQ